MGWFDGKASALAVSDDEIVLALKRRKNRERGSLLRRKCWCSDCKKTCPVHVLGAYFKSVPLGVQPFVSLSKNQAVCTLRQMLHIAEVPGFNTYWCHDLRRGHARDMQARGRPLWEILKAGEWRSAAFLEYLDRESLNNDAVNQAHIEELIDSESD